MIHPANPMVPQIYPVKRILRETHDTFTLEFPGFEPGFQPGQFNMVYVYGVGDVPISISGGPEPLEHTVRAVGVVTTAMKKLRKGAQVGIRGPYGSSWPVEQAAGSDVVLVAGGIGLAPLRPAIRAILSSREKYGKVVLLYGSRSPADLLYQREVERWRSRFDVDVSVTVDHAMGGWRGNVGFVTSLIGRALFDASQTVAMMCGPEVMMRFTAMELMNRGVESDQIYISMERNMKCAVGFCGHCQFGPEFICKDGPVFPYNRVQPWLAKGEI